MAKIRLWKIDQIGDSANDSFLPTSRAIDKLLKILSEKSNGEIIDLVWGPDITCQVIDEAVSDNILVPVQTLEDGTILYRLEEVKSA